MTIKNAINKASAQIPANVFFIPSFEHPTEISEATDIVMIIPARSPPER